MTNQIFPTYDVDHLSTAIKMTINGTPYNPEAIGLECIKFKSQKSIKKDEILSIEISIFTKSFLLEGKIENLDYDRDIKLYNYYVSVKFSSKFNFLKWMAVMKGIHRSRFKY